MKKRFSGLILLLTVAALVALNLGGAAQTTDTTRAAQTTSLKLIGAGILSDDGRISPDVSAEKLVWRVFVSSIIALSAFWAIALLIFAWRKQLDPFIELTKSGAMLKLVTVVAIVAIIFILGLLGRLKRIRSRPFWPRSRDMCWETPAALEQETPMAQRSIRKHPQSSERPGPPGPPSRCTDAGQHNPWPRSMNRHRYA